MSSSRVFNKTFEVSKSANQESNLFDSQKSHEKFWLYRASTKTDWHILLRCLLNLCGAVGFLVGSVGWVADFLMVGTFLFAGANVFYAVTGIWWALSTRRNLAHRIRLTGSRAQLLEQEDAEEGLPLAPLGLLPTSVPKKSVIWQQEEITKAFMQVARIEILGAICQICGAVGFTSGCFLSLEPDALFETNFLYLLGSCLFLIQGIIGQLMCGSITGPLLPLWPVAHRGWRTKVADYGPGFSYSPCCVNHRVCIHHVIPGAFLNTLGSVLFAVGSFCLFYEQYAWFGGWGYTYGSIAFVIATLADINGFLDALAIRLLQQEAPYDRGYAIA